MKPSQAQEELDRLAILAVLSGERMDDSPSLRLLHGALDRYDRLRRAAGYRCLLVNFDLELPCGGRLFAPWELTGLLMLADGHVCKKPAEAAIGLLTHKLAVPQTLYDLGASGILATLHAIEKATRHSHLFRIRRCSCSYEGIWQSFVWVGIQRGEDGAPDLELRNCRCGTTLTQRCCASA